MVEHAVISQALRVSQADEFAYTPRAVRRRRVVAILVATDTVLLLAAGIGAAATDSLLSGAGVRSSGEFVALSIGLAVVWLLALLFNGLYDPDRLSWGSGELSRLATSLSLGSVAFIMLLFLLRLPEPPRAWTLLAWLAAIVLLMGGRSIIRAVTRHLCKRPSWLQQPTLVVGSNAEAAEVARILKTDPGSGLIPVGSLASSSKDRLSLDFCQPELPCLGTALDLVDVILAEGIDTVIIVASAFDYEVLQRMLVELKDVPVSSHLSSGLSEVLTSRVLVREVSGIPVISLKGVSISRTKRVAKRTFDIAVGGLVTVLGTPLWLALAASIKLSSSGPVLYTQERLGKDGVPFRMYKFRSMVADADRMLDGLSNDNEATGPLFKIRSDPRVTPVGKWMRKFSIDEFPQLINVLKGEMSLVGPRPPLPYETLQYTEKDWRRLEAPPGMTGLWQISGRSALTFDEMVRLDVFYIDNWSVSLDLALLLRTLPAVLIGRGAY